MTTVVAAVIERGTEVLIGQRKAGKWHAFKWEFPGGKVELGEAPDAAIRRELEEELGIRADIGPPITEYEYTYPDRSPIRLMFYSVSKFEGTPENRGFLKKSAGKNANSFRTMISSRVMWTSCER